MISFVWARDFFSECTKMMHQSPPKNLFFSLSPTTTPARDRKKRNLKPMFNLHFGDEWKSFEIQSLCAFYAEIQYLCMFFFMFYLLILIPGPPLRPWTLTSPSWARRSARSRTRWRTPTRRRTSNSRWASFCRWELFYSSFNWYTKKISKLQQ